LSAPPLPGGAVVLAPGEVDVPTSVRPALTLDLANSEKAAPSVRPPAPKPPSPPRSMTPRQPVDRTSSPPRRSSSPKMPTSPETPRV
jgi:hypothetical protein